MKSRATLICGLIIAALLVFYFFLKNNADLFKTPEISVQEAPVVEEKSEPDKKVEPPANQPEESAEPNVDEAPVDPNSN